MRPLGMLLAAVAPLPPGSSMTPSSETNSVTTFFPT
jgi:hypothetical protein